MTRARWWAEPARSDGSGGSSRPLSGAGALGIWWSRTRPCAHAMNTPCTVVASCARHDQDEHSEKDSRQGVEDQGEDDCEPVAGFHEAEQRPVFADEQTRE